MIKQTKCIEFCRLFNEEHLSIVEIANIFSTTEGTVKRAIVRAGGSIPPTTKHRKYSLELVKEWVDLYQSGKSISEIALKYNTSAGVIQNRMMMDYNVEMRRKRVFTKEHKRHLGDCNRGSISEKRGTTLSEEQKEKIRTSVQRTMRTPEMRDYISKTMTGKLVGPKHPSWHGGISQKYASGYVNKYPAAFNKELRRTILARDNHTCQHCGCKDDLTVHHVDYDKHNNDPRNLVTACRSCNGIFNFDREFWMKYWKEFFRTYSFA